MTKLLTDSEIEEIVQIDKAIRHCWEDILERTDWDKETRDEHRNIAKWLEELKTSRETINRQQAEIDRYKGVIQILEKDVAAARIEGVKELAHQLIDKAEKGIVWACDVVDLCHDLTNAPTKTEDAEAGDI